MSDLMWSPQSWRALPILQQPQYADQSALRETVRQISSLPPLVSVSEIEAMRTQLDQAARGERFILQAC